MGVFLGFLAGAAAYFFVRCILSGFYTVEQNERAVVSSFGRAKRLPADRTTLDDPISQTLSEEHRRRYVYPQLQVVQPGGPYFKFPWETVHKVPVAIQTINIAHDPETPSANQGGTALDAVTKDQLNIAITGQLRWRVSERNLYAYIFGVKHPVAHMMGYFISILRERIANFAAPPLTLPAAESTDGAPAHLSIEGISINDLRKNLNELNLQMDNECLSSEARYGILLDASLITGIDPPQEIESALAAINTAHNEVSAEISVAQAMADQKIVQSRRAVEIETMRAQAEVQPLEKLADQLHQLNQASPAALDAYRRNVQLALFAKARRIIQETNR